jgi:predicted outer membrane repeat protein
MANRHHPVPAVKHQPRPRPAAAFARLLAPLALAGLALALGAALLQARPATAAPAADAVVSTCSDSAFNTALATVQASGGGSITFSCSGTIEFLSTKVITSAVTIDGGGVITFSGGGLRRLFFINYNGVSTLRNLALINGFANADGGAIRNQGHLAIENSTLRENNVPSNFSGGAIVTTGTLTLTNAIFINNTGGNGGAIYPRWSASRTTIRQSLFWNNRTTNVSTSGWGGAMLVWDGAVVTISETQFLSNTARSGGAIYVQSSPNTSRLDIASSQFISNATVYAGGLTSHGGAIHSNAGWMAIMGTQFSHNRTNWGEGGAVYNTGTLVLTGGQFLNNRVDSSDGVTVNGGGLYSTQPVTISGTSFVSNTAHNGGGLYGAGSVALSGGLFQGNQAPQLGYADSLYRGGGLYAAGTLTINGTHFISNTSRDAGGGVYVAGPASLSGGLFHDNKCTYPDCTGGGMHAVSSVVASGTSFVANVAKFPGGGALNVLGPASLTGAAFAGNECQGSFCSGGGLRAESTAALTNTQFIGNRGGTGGGAAVLGALTLAGGLFQNNVCTHVMCTGGGLFAYSSLSMSGTRLAGNRAVSGGGLGHASGNAQIANSLFAGNTATGGQGAALRLASPGSVSLAHNTIASPTVAGGSAVYVLTGTLTAVNNLIANSVTGYERAGGIVNENYTLFSSVTFLRQGGIAAGPDSFTGAPGFVNPAAGDFRLAAGSAARDAGVDFGISADFFGNPRPLGPGFDIGYHEYDPVRRLFLPLVRR